MASCSVVADVDRLPPAEAGASVHEAGLPERLLMAKEALAAVQESLGELEPRQQAVMEADLTHGGAASADDLADALQISRNAVYVARNGARRALHLALTRRGHEVPTAVANRGGDRELPASARLRSCASPTTPTTSTTSTRSILWRSTVASRRWPRRRSCRCGRNGSRRPLPKQKPRGRPCVGPARSETAGGGGRDARCARHARRGYGRDGRGRGRGRGGGVDRRAQLERDDVLRDGVGDPSARGPVGAGLRRGV